MSTFCMWDRSPDALCGKYRRMLVCFSNNVHGGGGVSPWCVFVKLNLTGLLTDVSGISL